MPNASSNAITSSTTSSESAPKSSTNDAVGVTSASSTPSCSTIICFTRSSTLAIPVPPRSLVARSVAFCRVFPGLLGCPAGAEYSRAKIVGLGPSEQPAHSIYPAPLGQLSGPWLNHKTFTCRESWTICDHRPWQSLQPQPLRGSSLLSVCHLSHDSRVCHSRSTHPSRAPRQTAARIPPFFSHRPAPKQLPPSSLLFSHSARNHPVDHIPHTPQ